MVLATTEKTTSLCSLSTCTNNLTIPTHITNGLDNIRDFVAFYRNEKSSRMVVQFGNCGNLICKIWIINICLVEGFVRSHKERDEKQKKQVKESYGEKNRKFRRTVYGHDDWLRHRSSERYSMNSQSILRSDVFRQLLVEVGAVTSMATKILIWNGCMLTGWIGFDGSLHEALLKSSLQDPTRFIISIPGLPFLLSSPSLGLLLGR